MILFAVYPVLIWLAAFRYRRQWIGYAVPVVGAAVPALGANLARGLFGADTGPSEAIGLQLILYGEAVMVGVFGLFLASVPRAAPGGVVCSRCHYNLAGLELTALRCPECDTEYHGPGSGREPRPVQLTPVLREPVTRRHPNL